MVLLREEPGHFIPWCASDPEQLFNDQLQENKDLHPRFLTGYRQRSQSGGSCSSARKHDISSHVWLMIASAIMKSVFGAGLPAPMK